MKRAWAYDIGLKPRRLGKGDIAAIGGHGFHAGMAHWNTSFWNHPRREDVQGAVEAGLKAITDEKAKILESGREVPDWELAYFNAIEPRVKLAIERYCENDPLIAYNLSIEDVELTLPHGNARLDLGVRDLFGLAVLDYKFKLVLDAKYYQKEVDAYKHSSQMFHYAWSYGELKGEPISTYYICLVVASPKFSARIHEFSIHPEDMADWQESSRITWADMDLEDLGIRRPRKIMENCQTRWGPCQFKQACFDCHRDVQMALESGEYVLAKEAE